jgi:CubicO group peptidase (beta-lactamase class C family)
MCLNINNRQNQSSPSILIQLLALIWVAVLLVSCGVNPPPTTQPTLEATETAPEPTASPAGATQESAATQSSSTEGDTDSPEEDVYWPTEAWRVAAPEEQGMDAALLQQMLDAIDEKILRIDSVLVVHNGYIVTEKYYPPYKQDTMHGLQSVTKSVVSALIGIAIQEGYINSVDDAVLDYYPERTFENDDALKRSITLEHLLTMSSGLAWDWEKMVSSRDWVGYTLDQPMVSEPGREFYYSSGSAHVLSAIIQEASGMNTLDFAQLYLFDPLGISDIRWKTDLDGIPKGGWGMGMTPRDMAKLDRDKRYTQISDAVQSLDNGRDLTSRAFSITTTVPAGHSHTR